MNQLLKLAAAHVDALVLERFMARAREQQIALTFSTSMQPPYNYHTTTMQSTKDGAGAAAGAGALRVQGLRRRRPRGHAQGEGPGASLPSSDYIHRSVLDSSDGRM